MDRATIVGLCKRVTFALAVAAGALAPSMAPANITYTYDSLGRVTSAAYPSGTTIVYTYDNAGNKTQQTVGTSSATNAIAVDDYITLQHDTTLKYPVLNNDYNPSGYTLNIASYTNGAHGTVTPDGGPVQLYYQPNAGFIGTDTYTYNLTDHHGGNGMATVHVTVTP
jgi:YD repeat-containing protein